MVRGGWAASVVMLLACGGQSTRDAPAAGADAGASTGGGGTSGAGSGGTGGTGGGSADRECETAADCRLVFDCCTCDALPRARPSPPSCEAACTEDACRTRGVVPEMVRCIGGRCILGYDCASARDCAGVPPNCSPGQIASGSEGCWGPCVPAPDCASVPSCAACDSATTVCLELDGGAHCVELPVRCLADRSCACVSFLCDEPSACIDLGANAVACR